MKTPTHIIKAPKSIKRLRQITTNTRDRLFNAASMVVAGQPPYDVIARHDLASVRHYRPLTESHIDVDGQRIEVARTRHAVPVVIVAPLAVNMLIYDLFPERSVLADSQLCDETLYHAYYRTWAARMQKALEA